MPPLDDAWAKLDRAKHHIADLIQQKSAFLDTNPYDVTPEYYADKDMTVYFLDHFTAVPVALPLIIGDAVHNLRSALDLAVWSAYKADHNDEGRHIYFPIGSDAATYATESARKLKGVKQAFQDAVAGIKPYRGGNDLFFGLNKLDLADKHQLLITPVICVGKIGMNVSAEYMEREFKGLIRFSDPNAIPPQTIWFDAPHSPDFPLAIRQGAPILSVTGDRQTHKDVTVTFDIGLAEPDIFRNRAASATLNEIANEVERVLTLLAGTF
jgi:hypothetical protein